MNIEIKTHIRQYPADAGPEETNIPRHWLVGLIFNDTWTAGDGSFKTKEEAIELEKEILLTDKIYVRTYTWRYPAADLEDEDVWYVKLKFNDKWRATDKWYLTEKDAIQRAKEIAKELGGEYIEED